MNTSAAIAHSLLRPACPRLGDRAGVRARRSVPQRTVSSTPRSRRPLGSEACLVDSYEGGQPPCTIPTKGAHPLREPPGGVPPPRGGAPGTHCASLQWVQRDVTARFRDEPS